MDLFKILIKKIVYKIPIKLLLIIILTLLILSVCISPSFAVDFYSSTYGSYTGFGSDFLNNVNNVYIPENNTNYDSFLCFRWYGGGRNFILFYNVADTGRVYFQKSMFTTRGEFIFENGDPTSDYVAICTREDGTFYFYDTDFFNSGNFRPTYDAGIYMYSNRSIYTNSSFNTYYMQSTDLPINNTPSFELNVSLSNTSNTTEPIYCYTDWYDISYSHSYECYISTNEVDWYLMHYETITDNGTTQFRFRYPILNNGTYYYKFTNNDTEEDYYASLQVTNILSNSINSGFTESGIPQPFLSFKQVNDNYIIFTQYFNYEDILKYQCYFTDDSSNTNYSSWNLANISSIYDTTFNKTNYYFSTSIPTNSENLTLYFVFYDTELEEYGYPSSITCDINGMDEYNNFLDNLINGETSPSGNFLDGFTVADITGIEQLFTKLYNAFCTDEVIDLTFTLPFVDKQVTISSDNISSHYPEALTSVVALFVWGIIGLYVIKDIRGMINKINEGNVENISSDVKKEVL